MDEELRALASDPTTPRETLQELAGNNPALRPLIAMNPNTYPALLEWLAALNDPAVNLALEQRQAGEIAASRARSQNQGANRVSVMQRGTALDRAATPGIAGSQNSAPLIYQANEQQGIDAGQRDSKGKILWILLALALILVVFFLVYTNFFGSSASPDLGSSEETSVAQDPEESGETESAEDAETDPEEGGDSGENLGEAEEPAVLFPAPGSALELAQIAAPSGNIACILSEAGASCSIHSFEFTGAAVTGCQGTPVTISTDPSGNAPSCATDPIGPSGATSLAYGDYATFGHGACHSTANGMICWDTTTGISFALARQGYLVGTDGLIETKDLPWVD